MNTTNATPTPAAPLTPEPPKCCPACLSTKFEDKMTRHFPHRVFDCGAYVELDTHEWHGDCSRAFSAAIALRQKLADEKTANECLQDELTVLRAERDAALARAEQAELSRDQLSDGLHVVTVQLTASRARAAELQAVCDAAIAWNLLYRVLPSREFWYGERAKLARENLSNAVNKYRDESETK